MMKCSAVRLSRTCESPSSSFEQQCHAPRLTATRQLFFPPNRKPPNHGERIRDVEFTNGVGRKYSSREFVPGAVNSASMIQFLNSRPLPTALPTQHREHQASVPGEAWNTRTPPRHKQKSLQDVVESEYPSVTVLLIFRNFCPTPCPEIDIAQAQIGRPAHRHMRSWPASRKGEAGSAINSQLPRRPGLPVRFRGLSRGVLVIMLAETTEGHNQKAFRTPTAGFDGHVTVGVYGNISAANIYSTGGRIGLGVPVGCRSTRGRRQKEKLRNCRGILGHHAGPPGSSNVARCR